MDISRISSAIDQLGYDAGSLKGTQEQDIQKFAQENGISVSEAKSILQQAEQKTQENEQMFAQQSAMLDYLGQDEEEEIIVVDDADFDSFLNEQSPEQQMQNIFAQQSTAKQNNNTNQQNFSQGENPFLKMKW